MRLALKIDVDTERGTRLGVPSLLADVRRAGVPATFFLSLGPDNTGRAITRIFRPGFLKKVGRTNVVDLYGWRTLLNGTLLPAPHIAQRHASLMRLITACGLEAGIHCHDHYRWQDHVLAMAPAEVQAELAAARREFLRVFGAEATCAAAPGWQANATTRDAYDRAGLLYASDTRGEQPYFPRDGGHTFSVLEIPTTLPTLDELIGRPEYPDHRIIPHLLSLLSPDRLNVFTLHAELEGMKKRAFFVEWLHVLRARHVEVVSLAQEARDCLARRHQVPVCALEQAPVDGRSGSLAVQGATVLSGV